MLPGEYLGLPQLLTGLPQLQEPDEIGSFASGAIVASHARGRCALLEKSFHRRIRDVCHRIGSG